MVTMEIFFFFFDFLVLIVLVGAEEQVWNTNLEVHHSTAPPFTYQLSDVGTPQLQLMVEGHCSEHKEVYLSTWTEEGACVSQYISSINEMAISSYRVMQPDYPRYMFYRQDSFPFIIRGIIGKGSTGAETLTVHCKGKIEGECNATLKVGSFVRIEEGVQLFLPVVIGDNVHISPRVVVLSGVAIGEGAIIGPGAEIKRDVRSFSIVGYPYDIEQEENAKTLLPDDTPTDKDACDADYCDSRTLSYHCNMLNSRQGAASVIGPIALSLFPASTRDAFLGHNTPEWFQIDAVGNGEDSLTQVPSIAQQFMSRDEGKKQWRREWTSALVDTLVTAVRRGEDISCADYPSSATQVYEAMQIVLAAFDLPDDDKNFNKNIRKERVQRAKQKDEGGEKESEEKEDVEVKSKSARQVRPLRVLVAGSISPWIEAVILSLTSLDTDTSDIKDKNCSNTEQDSKSLHPETRLPLLLYGDRVWTTDYNTIHITSPKIHFIPMSALKAAPPRPLFDIIVTFSSIEHDGLGRYGDPINPTGDIAAMAEYRHMLKIGGFLLLGVPVVRNDTWHGYILGNLHRIYSMDRLQAMCEGFVFIGDRVDGLPKSSFLSQDKYHPWQDWKYQPIFILRRES